MNHTTNEPISDERKKKIATDLADFIQKRAGGSANQASKMLKNVNNRYISDIKNDKHEAMSDDAWRNIEKQVSTGNEWQIVETRGFQFLSQLYADARLHSNTYGIIGITGAGKTEGAVQQRESNVFVIKSNEYFTAKTFLEEILIAMGKSGYGSSIAHMMNTIISSLLKLDCPLIVIDEADKLNDKVLYFFISLYNALEDKCGIIIQATPYLKKRIEDGVLKGKKGYHEINSRIGRTFLEVPKPSLKDVTKIVQANGIYETEIIQEIFNTCEADLRVVKRKVHKFIQMSKS